MNKRLHGAFFTPTIWVDEAHRMITESLGSTWKDDYAVWDCAAGTAQLTRDYNFKELYISTLEQGDIDIIRDMGYNRGATIFQYDFLSECGIEKIPVNLRKAFEQKKKILFLINPPYGKSAGGESGVYNSTPKESGYNIINDVMKNENYGKPSAQLYAQFLFKIKSLQNLYNCEITICIYSPPLFITGTSFKIFRSNFYNNFQYLNGMLFKSSEFSDTSGEWGISFTIWKKGKNKKNINILCKKIVDFEINTFEEKELYNTDYEVPCSLWVRKEISNLKTYDEPKLSSAIKVVENKQNSRKLENSIGSMYNVSNNVESNTQSVSLFSSSYSNSQNAFPIIPENFSKSIALFVSRNIESNWINCKDEYLKPPDEILNSDEYKQWNNDAIVYSLFNGSSQQSSLRQIDYKKQKWNIFNHFFFMSNKEMMELANKHKFPEMYEDAKKFNEDRYVYKLLEEVNLSPDAKQVLEYAREMIRKSIELRKIWHEENPEYHLDTWDAGYAQHRELWKKHFKKEFDVFKELYKEFGNRMREGVYKFGFLK